MLGFLLSIANESDHDKVLYLYDNFHSDMLRAAKHKLIIYGAHDPERDAEDVVQSALVRIVTYIDDIDFTLDLLEIRSYVLTIVKNEAIKFMKDANKYADVEELYDNIPDETFLEELSLKARYDEVVKVIEGLDDKYGSVLLLKFRNNMSLKEIADFIGIAPKSVSTRLVRGKHMVLKALGKEEKQYGAKRKGAVRKGLAGGHHK